MVVARPDKLCLHMCYCQDFYRTGTSSPHGRQTPYDTPVGRHWRLNCRGPCILVHVDIAMSPGAVFLAAAEAGSFWKLYEYRPPH